MALANSTAAVTLAIGGTTVDVTGGAILDVTGGAGGVNGGWGTDLPLGSRHATSADATGGSSEQQGGIRGATLPAGALIFVTLSEAALRKGVSLPSSHDGLLQVTAASVSPVDGFKHDVAPAYSFKDSFSRALAAAYTTAAGPGGPIVVHYDVSAHDGNSGYNGIQKKAAFAFSLPGGTVT
jgi:hypothetical protein